MGCDIHAHIEVKIGSEWAYWSECDIDRDYDLFSLMAGVCRVRESPKPIAQPRGLPFDATRTTCLHYDHLEGDAHSASYLRSEEVKEMFELMPSLKGESLGTHFFGNHIMDWWETRERIPGKIRDFRLVLWFED